MKFGLNKFNTSSVGGLLLSIAVAISLFLFFGISYFYVYLPSSTNHGETITVPKIEGMHIDELEDFLVKRNLRYTVNDSSYSEKYAALTVLKQYPAEGTKVKENRNILISINRVTPPSVPMPDLVDGSIVNAEAVLKGNELKRGKITFVPGQFLNLVKEMKYKGKKIAAGERVPKGSVIDLVIEDGGSSVISAPDVVGYTLEDAKVPIFGSNLYLGEIYLVGDTVNNGLIVILKQQPEPNSKMRAGDPVNVWVGKEGTPIPDDDEL